MRKNRSHLLLVILMCASLLLGACETSAPDPVAEEPAERVDTPPEESVEPVVTATPEKDKDGDEGGFWERIPLGWKIAGGVFLALIVLSGLGGDAKIELQNKAKDENPPRRCQEGSEYVHRKKITLKPGRWKITAINIKIDPKSPQPVSHSTPTDLVAKADKLVRQKMVGESSAKLNASIKKISKELTALVLAWQSLLKERPLDFLVETHLEGGEASGTFVHYRCVGGKWQHQGEEWTVPLTAVDYFGKKIRAPQEKETKTAYRKDIQNSFVAYLTDVITKAAKLF